MGWLAKAAFEIDNDRVIRSACSPSTRIDGMTMRVANPVKCLQQNPQIGSILQMKPISAVRVQV
jgi:gentisate 1,2-dioxygenase